MTRAEVKRLPPGLITSINDHTQNRICFDFTTRGLFASFGMSLGRGKLCYFVASSEAESYRLLRMAEATSGIVSRSSVG
jgi:hypothetical protein